MRKPNRSPKTDPLVEQVSRLTEATFDGVFVYDSGTVLNATPKAALLFRREILSSCSVAELIAKESHPALLQHLHSFSNGPCPAMGLRGDGSSFPIEVTVRACLTLNGRKVQILALRDLSHEGRRYRTDGEINRSRLSTTPSPRQN